MWSKFKSWASDLRAWVLGVVIIIGFTIAFVARMLFGRRTPPGQPTRDQQRDLDAVDGLKVEQRRLETQARDQEGQAEQHRRRGEAEQLRVSALPATARLAEFERTRARLLEQERVRRAGKGGTVILFGWLMAAGVARADEPMPHPVTSEAGVWVPDAQHALDAGRLAELVEARESIHDYRLTLRTRDAARHNAQAAFAVSQARAQALDVSIAHLRVELAEERAWWRSERLWGGVGIAVGVLTVIGIGAAL